ncbi:MAG: MlaD family protein, partial [Gemmatimonadota bacterium]
MDSPRATGRRTTTGAVLVGALAAAAALIFLLDDLRRLTAERYEIAVALPEAHDLRSGGEVRVAGQAVGAVRAIEVAPRPTGPARVVATVELAAAVRPHVRRHSRARLVQPGLGGATLIEIDPGPRDSPPLRPGDTLVAAPPPDGDRLARGARALLAAWDTLDVSLRALRTRLDTAAVEPARTIEGLDAVRTELDRLARRYRA